MGHRAVALLALIPLLKPVHSRGLAFASAWHPPTFHQPIVSSKTRSSCARGLKSSALFRRGSGSIGWAIAFACATPTSLGSSAARTLSATARTTASMAQPEVAQFACLSDNYGFLLHCPETGATAAIDTPDVEPYMKVLKEKGWTLSHILNTHHHHDHAGGNTAIKKLTGCKVVGPRGEADKIPGIDEAVDDGDSVAIGNQVARVLNVGGHTKGHVAYHFDKAGIAFVGDSLFAMGCGRLFEGTYEQMFGSLQKLANLPDETLLYCAHEYTQSNARFALAVEPGNSALIDRAKEVDVLRSQGKPTVPTIMRVEKETNPFLRWDSPEIRQVLGLQSASGLEVFAETRKRKDKF